MALFEKAGTVDRITFNKSSSNEKGTVIRKSMKRTCGEKTVQVTDRYPTTNTIRKELLAGEKSE